jgi:hypothetical protein
MSDIQTEPKRIGAGKAGPGRPKGSVNKTGRAAKEVIAEAAERLGGVDRIVSWAQESPENEKAFWSTIYPRLVPLDAYVSGNLSVNWPLPRSTLDGV